MTYYAKIIADSLAPCGKRLTTFEIGIPKFIQAELNTHRLLSRNSASTRAIPTQKLIDRVLRDPVMPIFWGKNQPGMQAAEELDENAKLAAMRVWMAARRSAMACAEELLALGVHKQIAGRIIEPWMFTSVVVSATEWDNFYGQRCTEDAQPEFRHVAMMMREAHEASKPVERQSGEWHLPYVEPGEFDESHLNDAIRVSTARVARVSSLTHGGRRDLAEDLSLHDRLVAPGHWSPFEHVASAMSEAAQSGNFIGWAQYRKTFEQEHIGGPRT